MKAAFFIAIVILLGVVGIGLYKAVSPASPASAYQGVTGESSFIAYGATSTKVASIKTASSSPQAASQTSKPSAAPAPETQTPTPTPTTTTTTITPRSQDSVCNTSLIGSDGYDSHHIIDLATCKKLNDLYAAGKIAGNVGDLYDNRDNLHVNLCVDWSPNPNCPKSQSLFPQHDWKLSGAVGRATTPQDRPTLGQASWSGTVTGDIKHSIPFDMYGSQAGADTLYNLYINNNLYVYPSLYEDSFAGSAYDTSVLSDPTTLNELTLNKANTPYVIGSKQICDCGAGSLRVHDASGSDLPFIELGFAGLAAFQPDVKQALISKGMLMSTLQALIRYSHRSVTSNETYLTSIAHRSSYMAHYLSGGAILPAYNAGKLVDIASGMSLSDVPPLPKLSLVQETFTSGETLFNTPGAIARSVALNTPSRSITVSAAGSIDVDGGTNHEYRFVVLSGDPSLVHIDVDSTHPAQATITFSPSPSVTRFDVGVFVKKPNGAYYSVPGIVSEYVHQ